MSQDLVVCLIAVAVNLVGMLILFAWMAQGLTRLAWRGRRILGVIATLVLTQLFWLLPAWLIVIPRDADGASSYALWFGNWLIAGFSIVLLAARANNMPRSLEDSARIDGLGAFATWQHVVFPFVRRDLILIAVFTVMATLLPFWGFVTLPHAGESIVIYQKLLSPPRRLAVMAGASLLATLPLIAVLFAARRRS